jgi:hypothetical protein
MKSCRLLMTPEQIEEGKEKHKRAKRKRRIERLARKVMSIKNAKIFASKF